jgi:hypothetical protein
MLKGAIATGPAILTVTSRPAWALKPKNCTDSGVESLNPSGRELCEGNEGCSPGFWKEHQDIWFAATGGQYIPSMLFSTVFMRDAFGDTSNGFTSLTLGEVILMSAQGQNGDDRDKTVLPAACFPLRNDNQVRNRKNLLISLGFHSVAGILNAASSVDFGPGDGSLWSSADVIMLFQDAYDSCNIEPTKGMLDFANNQFCSLDAFGRPIT